MISSNKPMPLVSVLMPVYNARKYLRHAVNSILEQTLTNFELLAIDDGSTDESLKVLRSIRDPRLRIIEQRHAGLVAALNRGLQEARGTYVARMDGDDLCDPWRFDLQVKHLRDNEDCVAVGTWLAMVDPYTSPIGEQKPPTDHAAIDARLIRGDGSAMVHGTLMISRAALHKIGGWIGKHDGVEDLDLMLRLAEAGRVANVPKPLYTYRRHPGSVCARRYDEMCGKIRAVLQEAYDRRGLGEVPPLRELRPDLVKGDSLAQTYRNWACHAIHHCNRPVARRHALQALVREPWNVKSWKVLRWTVAT